MDPAIRRQLLADLGIVPWQLRVSPGNRGARVRQEDMQLRARADEPRPPGPAAATRETAEAPATAEAAVQPFSVLSLVSGATVMLVEGDCSRRDLRLAMDILCAVGGDAGRRPRSRRFDWPPPGTPAELAGAEAGERALGAFVDKDIQDHGAQLLLCTTSVTKHLAALHVAVPRHELPELATLGQAPDTKRALWAALRRAAR